MAQRRMFSMKVIDTDAFCEMPASAQNLYFQIGMRADDEGFYAGVLGLMAKIHASKDDLNVLIARRYILDRVADGKENISRIIADQIKKRGYGGYAVGMRRKNPTPKP